MNLINKIITLAFVLPTLFACGGNSDSGYKIPNNDDRINREFKASFESADDFSGFYITPQAHLGSTFHELSETNVFSGDYAHKAWVTGMNPPSTEFVNNNHRGYPTVQLYKTENGSFESPIMTSFWVWLDIDLQENGFGEENDCFSFATFTDDESDNWNRTVLVNLNHDGFVHLQHTSGQGENETIFQTSSLMFPLHEWVELKIYLDFSDNGYAKVWQNGELVSHAYISNIQNRLAQAHLDPEERRVGKEC